MIRTVWLAIMFLVGLAVLTVLKVAGIKLSSDQLFVPQHEPSKFTVVVVASPKPDHQL